MEYSPPEILNELVDQNSEKTKFELGKIDAYSWAMAFFSLLTGRGYYALDEDIGKYKIHDEKVYNEYLTNIIKCEIEKLETKDKNEENIKSFVKKIIAKQLKYKPSKRLAMPKIVMKMKKFETKKNIEIEYKKKKRNSLKAL